MNQKEHSKFPPHMSGYTSLEKFYHQELYVFHPMRAMNTKAKPAIDWKLGWEPGRSEGIG